MVRATFDADGNPGGGSQPHDGGVIHGRRTNRRAPTLAIATLVAGVGLIGACSRDGRELRPPRPEQNESIITTTSAPEQAVSFEASSIPGLETDIFEISLPWSDDDVIPVQYTCRGADVSPPLAWFDVTADAVSMAIVFYESAPNRAVHWIVANLDPTKAFLEAGTLASDALVGANDPLLGEPTTGYRGPCPSPGETRSYTLEVHALSQYLELPFGTPADDLLSAIDMASIQMASVTGTATG